MKLWILSIFLLLGICTLCGREMSSMLDENKQSNQSNEYSKCINNQLFELKIGYFIPWDKALRQVYYSGGLDLRLSYTQPVSQHFSVYFDSEYVYLSGKSVNFHQHTHLNMFNLSAGLEIISSLYYNLMKCYGVIGPRYFFVFQNNNPSFVDKHLNQNNIGGFVGIGVLFEPIQHFIIDVWMDGSYCKMHFHPHRNNVFSNGSVQVGGIALGLGVGYSF